MDLRRRFPALVFLCASVVGAGTGGPAWAEPSPEELVRRGLAAAEIGRYSEALEHLERADESLAKDRPERRDLHFGLGLTRYGREEFAAAVGELTRAIELDPDGPEPYGWRALARLHLHEDEAAARDFADCFAREPRMRAVFETFAAEVRKNRPDQAPSRSE